MKVYIDSDYRCHTTNDGSMRGFDVLDFDGKCAAYIENCRYVPQGESWTRDDGIVFQGEMISPCIDSRVREAYQVQYEAMLPEMEDMKNALVNELGVNPNG